jgi:23S rRNA pseudouridine1911/1915/1917 synthase
MVDVRRFIIPPEAGGTRLDHFIVHRMPGHTRSQIQKWIRSGRVLLDGQLCRCGTRVRPGQELVANLPEPRSGTPQPEAIPLQIHFEDEHLLVVEKPAGMMVHPAAGQNSGTLVNALLAHTDQLSRVGRPDRPGIVHRLDRDTSGLLAVAKTDRAHLLLSAQFRMRQVCKRYFALVVGKVRPEGMIIDRRITRDPRVPIRMCTRHAEGRHAVTLVRTLGYFQPLSALDIRILTGRTHQIRVHLASLGHPVVGEYLYGRRNKTTLPARLTQSLAGFALHARVLAFTHPVTGAHLRFESPLPPRFEPLLRAIGAWGKIRFEKEFPIEVEAP